MLRMHHEIEIRAALLDLEEGPGKTRKIQQILVGHASDDIRLSAEVGFTTQKLLPFVVTTATTVGEMMEDIRTRPVITEMLANIRARVEITRWYPSQASH